LEDIPLFIDWFATRMGRKITISDQARQMLMSHAWPGNVRELLHALERAWLLAGEEEIQPSHLPPQLRGGLPVVEEEDDDDAPGLDERLKRIEKTIIQDALQQTQGVQVRAAELLGIQVRSLWHRIKKLEIDVTRYKP
jgi:DNA-binding NtrC family response regulator